MSDIETSESTLENGGKKQYAKSAQPIPVLTDEQNKLIDENWQMDVKELTRLVFNDPTIDGRSVKCKAIKLRLAATGKASVPVVPATPESDSVLTEDQKEYIRNNMGGSSPLEMAKVLFGNDNIMVGSPQCRMIVSYCREIDPSFRRGEEWVDGPYEPPSDMKQLVPKVNRYAVNPKKDGKPIYDYANLSNNDRKQLQGLLSYMKMVLYRIEGNKYIRRDDRELFESTFIAVCWDKPDLLSEEVIQYISFAAETVRRTQIERTIAQLDERMQSVLETPGAKIQFNEVEFLNAVREKANASMKQSASLLKTLVGDRAKRLNDKIQASASLHNLVERWKHEEDRKKIIQMNERKQKAALKQEIERLSDMDSLKAEIFGLSKDDILN